VVRFIDFILWIQSADPGFRVAVLRSVRWSFGFAQERPETTFVLAAIPCASRSDRTWWPQDAFGETVVRIRAHNRESLTARGRDELRRRDGNCGGQAGLTAIRKVWATVRVHAAWRLIGAMVVRRVMLGAVACLGSGLLLVDGVSSRARMDWDLQNQCADGKQQDADRKPA